MLGLLIFFAYPTLMDFYPFHENKLLDVNAMEVTAFDAYCIIMCNGFCTGCLGTQNQYKISVWN